MSNVVITNNEDAKKFVLGTTDTSIEMHLICFEARGIPREKIVDLVCDAVLHVHELISNAGLESDGINVNNCICMMMFSSAMKAYLDVIDNMAKEKGVDKEVLLNEMVLDEIDIIRKAMKKYNP